ncbi:MAG: hypothetical protein AB8B92_04355, partial [Gammaproteobacteria bacterium]
FYLLFGKLGHALYAPEIIATVMGINSNWHVLYHAGFSSKDPYLSSLNMNNTNNNNTKINDKNSGFISNLIR